MAGRRVVGGKSRRRVVRHRRGSARRVGARLKPAVLAACAGLLIATPWLACLGGPPREADDLCSIFREKRGWHREARRAFERWGVPESVQLAIVHQESSFRSDARPARYRYLGFLPGPRPSSAYGYGQVVDATWDSYRKANDRPGAARDDFADVADFIGWYVDRIHHRTGVAKDDAVELYAAYHEGPAGYLRGTHLRKPTVSRTAVRVGHRAAAYQSQYAACHEDLSRRRFLGLF